MEDFATNPEKEKTRKGTGYGAAAGAVVGLLSAGNNPFKSAMIGAAAGALVGGSVGYYMDKQEAKLRQQMAGTGVDVVRKGDNITLDIPGGVTFAFDSADLNSQFYPVLDKVAGTLSEYDKTVIEVAGHTDSVGSDAYNQQLSEKRGNSVAAYLSQPRRRSFTRGDGRRRRGSPGCDERDRGRSRAEPPRRNHDRAGDRGKRAEGEAGVGRPGRSGRSGRQEGREGRKVGRCYFLTFLAFRAFLYFVAVRRRRASAAS